MTTHPITLTPDQLRAAMAGRLTQVRFPVTLSDPSQTYAAHDGDGWPCSADDAGDWHRDRCPWGVVGDRLLCWYPDEAKGGKWCNRLDFTIVAVRVERLADMTEADALACGFDIDTCVDVFDRAAGNIVTKDAYFVEDKDGNASEGWMCCDCAESELSEDGYLNWGCTPESDGPAYCEKCHVPLVLSLTKYGIERELMLEDDSPENRQYFPMTGQEARIKHMIADGIGDLREEHHGRMAQMAYATWWTAQHGHRHPWSSSPWAWVLDVRRVGQGEVK